MVHELGKYCQKWKEHEQWLLASSVQSSDGMRTQKLRKTLEKMEGSMM
jgi:hypothetical protein